MRRGPAVFFLLCVLLAAAYGAGRAATNGWQRVTSFAPAYFRAARPTTGSPPMAERLVVVLADGLTAQDAPLLPSLDWLRRRGAVLRLRVSGSPGHLPLYAALFSGALPEHSGILGAGSLPAAPLQVDTLVAAAARAKLTTGGAGAENLTSLFGPSLANWQTDANPARFLDRSQLLLAKGGPQLVILQTDQLPRSLGSGRPARSTPAYRQALAELDAQLTDIVSRVDLGTTAVLVIGTQPATPGWWAPGAYEIPVIMAGQGIKAGARADATALDMAATASVLLGAPVPLVNSGSPALAALTVDGRQTDLVMQRVLASRRAFTDAALQGLGTLEAVPAEPTAAKDAPDYLATMSRQLRSAQWQHWKLQVTERWPYVAAALLLPLLYLLIALRQPFGGAILAGLITYSVAFQGLFMAGGGRYSANTPGLDQLRPSVASGMTAATVGAMALACVVTGYVLSRKGFKHNSYIAAASLHTALTIAVVVALPVAVTVVVVGWDFPFALPATGLLVWFFSACAQVVVIGVLGVVWAILTGRMASFCRQRWPLKEVGDPELNADKVLRMRQIRRSARSAQTSRRKRARPTSRR